MKRNLSFALVLVLILQLFASYVQVSADTLSTTESYILAKWAYEEENINPTDSTPANAAAIISADTKNTATIKEPLNAAGAPYTKVLEASGWSVDNSFSTVISTEGYSGIKISSVQRSTNTGPTYFTLEYSVDGSNWEVLKNQYQVKNNWTDGKITDLEFPSDADNLEKLYIRYRVTSDGQVSNTDKNISSGGASCIADVVVTADKLDDGNPPTPKILKASFTANSTRGNYWWAISKAPYVFQAGDCIEYDVYLTTNAAGIGGVEVYCTNNADITDFKFREQYKLGEWQDKNGISGIPAADLTQKAYGQWYSRAIAVPAKATGLTLRDFCIGIDNSGHKSGDEFNAYYKNIRITNGGETVCTIYDGGEPDENVKVSPGSNTAYDVVLTPVNKIEEQVSPLPPEENEDLDGSPLVNSAGYFGVEMTMGSNDLKATKGYGLNTYTIPLGPMEISGTVYVPLSDVLGHLGGDVKFNPETQYLTIKHANKTITHKLGTNTITFGGSEKPMSYGTGEQLCSVPLNNSTVLVPLDFFKYLDAKVGYDAPSGRIKVVWQRVSTKGAEKPINAPTSTDIPESEIELRFAVSSDSQGVDNGLLNGTDDGTSGASLEGVLSRIKSLEKQPSFIIGDGDLVSGSMSKDVEELNTQLQNFRTRYTKYFDINTFMPIIGNHEQKGSLPMRKLFGDVFAEFKERTDINFCENYDYTAWYYDVGDTRIYGLNSCSPKEEHSITNGQLEWLKSSIDPTKKQNIFIFHEPAFPTWKSGNSMDMNITARDEFWKIVDSVNMPLVFVGHEHLYSRKLINSEFNETVNGTEYNFEKQIYQVHIGGFGGGTNGTFDDVKGVITSPASIGVRHFAVVDVLKNGDMHIQAIDTNGNLLDDFTVTKEGTETVRPVNISFETEEMTLSAGKTQKISVTEDLKNPVFASGNTEIAIVDNDGTIHAKAVGSTIITVSSNGAFAALTLNVTEADPTAPVELIVAAGEEKAMLAWEAPSDAEKIEVQISSDGGNTWTTLSDASGDSIRLSKAVAADSTGVEVLGLTADREYNFKLLVTGGVKEGESTIARVTPTAVPVLPDSISTAETEWRYLDNNTDPGAEQDRYAWTRPDFDDSAWKTAKGSFGAKNGGKSGISGGFTVNTLLNQYINGVSGDDIPAYFFRTKINIKDASKIETLTGSIVYDDAAIVYINGVKAAAFDEPDGGYASNMSYGGSNADAPKRAEINITDTSMLKDGANTIAVELHNGRSSSSDIYLDFISLTANAALELNATAGERDVKLEWTPLPKDAFVGLQISADGANWYSLSETPVDSNDAANGAYLTKEITAADTSADVCGLKGGTKYQFRLVVAVGDNPADILTAEATPTAAEPEESKISIGDITYSGGIITVKYTSDDTVKDGEMLGFLAFAAGEEDTEDTAYTDQNIAYQTIFSHSSGVESISFPMPYVTANGVAGIDTTKALIVKIGGEKIPTAAKKFVIPDEPSESGDEFKVKAESGDGKVSLTWPESTDAESISVQISDNGANWKTLSDAENEDGIYLSRNVSASDKTVDILGLTNGKTYMFKLVITGGSKAGEYLASASPAGEENPDKPSQPISFTASAGEKKAVLNWPDTAQGAKAVGVEISLNGQNWSALSGSALTAGGALNGAYLNGAISTSATTVEVRGLTAGVTYFFKLTVVGGTSAGEYTASAVPTDSGNTGGGSGSGSGSKGNTWSSLPSGGGAFLPTQPTQTPASEENDKPGTDEPSVNDLPSFMPDSAKQEIFEQAPWAIPYISTLVKLGAIDGTADSIRPSEKITRAEFVKIIVSVLGLELDYKADSGFSDAARGEWYTPYIAAGVKSGIIKGMGDGTFGVDICISRQDIAAIIYRAAQKMLEKGSLEMFSDASSVSDYAADGVSALTKAGIINGMGDGTFAPLNHATRAEAAKMLAGIYSYMEAQTAQELEQQNR